MNHQHVNNFLKTSVHYMKKQVESSSHNSLFVSLDDQALRRSPYGEFMYMFKEMEQCS